MPWQPNPYSFPLFISALVALTLAIMVWRRRPAPGTGPLAMMLLTAALWAGGYGFLWGAPTLAGKLFWFIFSLLGVIGGTPAFFAFVLQYTGRHHWLSRPVLGGLALEACVAFSLLLTNAAHGWWYTNPFISATGALQIEWGSGFWVHSTYVYSLVLIGYGLLVQAFFRAPPLYRAQTGTILLGASAHWPGV